MCPKSLCLMVLCLAFTPAQPHALMGRADPSASEASAFTVNMPGAQPKGTDAYLCTAFAVADLPVAAHPFYVTQFEPNQAQAERAHHMLLYACNDPPQTQPGQMWDCRHHTVCRDRSSTMYAWAKNAEATVMPPDVSFAVDRARYLVLQVHYVNPLTTPDHTGLKLYYQAQVTKYSAGIFLLLRSYLSIPPNTAKVHGDINCQVATPVPLHLFAYRTHAHQLGSVISGYIYSAETDNYTEIARGNPQWPQAFYPMKQPHTIQPGEFLAARCTYNTLGFNQTTKIGATSGDEMCNLYLMYYIEGPRARFLTCMDAHSTKIQENMPLDSDVPLPPNPLLEEHAKHSSSNSPHTGTHMESTSIRKGDLDNPLSAKGVDQELSVGGRRKGDLEAPEMNQALERVKTMDIQMNGAKPNQNDDYLCQAFPIKKLLKAKTRVYITGYDANASADKAHHMILQKCKKPIKKDGEIWNCLHHTMCDDQSKIMYAWAKDAPPTQLPQNVGFSLDGNDGYLVLQVHYKHPLEHKDFTGLSMHYTDERPTNFAGIYLMYRSYLRIPPQKEIVHGDINCEVHTPMTLFAFRTHTHTLGKVVTGFKVNEGKIHEFARGDPQKPQTFYPMKRFETVNPGDYLVARCSFNSMTKNETVDIGATSADEMCNLYIMYYTQDESTDFQLCGNEEVRKISSLIPDNSDTPLDESQPEEPLSYANNEDEREPTSGNSLEITSFIPSKIKKQDTFNRMGKDIDQGLYPVPNWPPKETMDKIGQLSGVAIDIYGNPMVFHRGDRIWNYNTFKSNNEYNGDKSKPIEANTILTFDASGNIINSWGANLFFLPHMLTVDKQNNIWVTDVAMHQVFKFAPYGGADKKPLIVLGQPFSPGNDDRHYCKPTAVAVSDDGETFYVADGYCNSRIIKYQLKVDKDGYHNVSVLTQWGQANGAGLSITRSPYAFNIPHGLTLAADKNLLCVADRENGRIQCFNADSGKFVKSLKPPEIGSTVYGLDYAPVGGGRIYAVCGPEPFGAITGKVTKGYVIDINSGQVVSTFNGEGQGFNKPHDVAVSADGSTVYEVELQPFKVWKLTDGKTIAPTTLRSFPAVPDDPASSGSNRLNPATKLAKESLKRFENIIPTTGVGATVAILSLVLTCLLSLCLTCRRCRKRGKGAMNGGTKKKGDGKLDLGDFLGRSKDGFQPLKQDDDEDETGNLSSESDDLEEFSVPALRA
eukprot:maker-scaffold428_size174301-snap-gene-0.22 protein:Tk03105 transcript:maker-scaffold428_size174301-snap-gene-0.22-mRNA-1 annotation:"af109920_1alpha-amidating enzyme precursor 2"